MSEPINDGGPAFPHKRDNEENGVQWTEQYEGMSLRDYFAAAALPGVLSGFVDDCQGDARASLIVSDGPEFVINHAHGAEAVARICYEYADAMLAGRVKGP